MIQNLDYGKQHLKTLDYSYYNYMKIISALKEKIYYKK